MVLDHGLDFCIPLPGVKREEVFSEFEILNAQAERLARVSETKIRDLRAKLNDLAHSYASTPVSHSEFKWRKEQFAVIKTLRQDSSLVITRPDKGSGVVILNHHDYVDKMSVILNDKDKFEKLGPVATHDSTVSLETKFQKKLVKWVKNGVLPKNVASEIRPSGSIRSRLYGLPKTHKADIPLRPILSMVGSSQHKTSKWIFDMLQPVLQHYSKYCLKDSFYFADFIKKSKIVNKFMCSYDISNLFTCVPILETIDICADFLYRGPISPPPIPENIFIELMKFATTSVEFSFNNIMYRRKDGVSMGSVLGPTMANIFVGFHEERLLSKPTKPLVYFRYVDDTFCLFNDQTEANTFFSLLNGMHPALKYTYEGECNSSIAFLDVLVTKTPSSYHTSIYRKPTFTGLYTRWDSFCRKKRKINLIWTLTQGALLICSKLKLDEELETITDTLSKNGYQLDVIRSTIQKKLAEFSRIKENIVAKCPIYLRLPWLGRVSERFAKQISSAVHGCYFAANVRVVFSTRTLLPSSRKDVLPPTTIIVTLFTILNVVAVPTTWVERHYD